MAEVNWKNKYDALKSKFMESVDMAFRLGYEQGAQESQMQQMQQQQQQQADEMAAQAGLENPDMAGGQPGEEQPGEPGMEAGGASMDNHPEGSELDKHINELEGMLGKSEIDATQLMMTLNSLKKMQKSIKLQDDLKKSAQAIPEIAKNLHKPQFKMNKQASANLNNNAKDAVNLQEKIVTDIMSTWEKEEKQAGNDILSIIKVEGQIKD